MSWSDVTAEASELVHLAGERGLTIRLLGSAGIRLHCEASASRMDELERPTKDVDVVIPNRDRGGVRALLEQQGYDLDRDMLVTAEGQRFLFRHPGTGLDVDVFVDRLAFCHTLDVRDRLASHPVTLPVEDLLLSKAQIVELTPNDVKDLVTLLSAHEVREDDSDDPETLSATYVARVLARDWGFHHTVTRNLSRLRGELADGRVDVLTHAIEREEKSLKWRMRARVGERVQWYADVDEREATY